MVDLEAAECVMAKNKGRRAAARVKWLAVRAAQEVVCGPAPRDPDDLLVDPLLGLAAALAAALARVVANDLRAAADQWRRAARRLRRASRQGRRGRAV
jgi:hypothetical protein